MEDSCYLDLLFIFNSVKDQMPACPEPEYSRSYFRVRPSLQLSFGDFLAGIYQ